MITRRHTLGLLAATAGAGLIGLSPASAQNVAMGELMTPGPLGDVWIGPESAKATIVEYASLTCPHCAHFHTGAYKELKNRYLDSGQVRFTLREFPLDPVAMAGFMLARSDGPAKYYPIIDLLFETQKAWAFSERPLDGLRSVMKQAGFSQEKVDTVLRDQKLYDAVNAVKNRGADVLKVASTPTFFINGERKLGAQTIDELDKTIKPLLGA